jgi:hypothetical protein
MMTELGLFEAPHSSRSVESVFLKRSVISLLVVALGYGIALGKVREQVNRHDQQLAQYEDGREGRERRIATLEADQKAMQKTIDEMRDELNKKLDRLLYAGRR